MKKLPLILALALFTISFAACSSDRTGETIAAADLDALMTAGNAPLILDVRSKKEYDGGHIPGAINIPHTEIEARIAELDGHKNDMIVLHCRSGRRVIPAEETLQLHGFTKTVELEGNMMGWEAGDYPVE